MPHCWPLSQSCPAKRLRTCFIALLSLTSASGPACATPAAAVYQQKCASCHGVDGSGVVDHYDQPLVGDESVSQLAKRIAETMPEHDPEACTGDEAQRVAAYIHREFYSVAAQRAQGRLTAPRIELARLTVPQYRNSVADLIASCTPGTRRQPIDEPQHLKQTGLHGTYYKSKKMNKADDLQLERIDSQVDFDFADGSPAAGIPNDQFAIVWEGSVWARDTGPYDFRIETPNGVRLYLNSDAISRHGKLRDDSSETIQSRLIDGWVSSGNTRTLTGRLFLLGGRRYPIRLEFFKYQEPTASIRLDWKPPHGVWTVPDAQVLSPATVPRTFVVDTPFPADDRSLGYERGTSVSQQWHTAISNAALATADEVIGRLPQLSGMKKAQQNPAKLADFVARLARVAFRRPLTDAENELYRETLFQDDSPESSVRRAVLLILTSPHFLYTDLAPHDVPPTAHTVASRLAFALWDSLPDAELCRVANQNRLATPAQIEAQADRMLVDPRTRAKMQSFFRHWLELEERNLAKDKQLYPDFDEALIADLRRSLELFVDQVLWSPTSDYRELLQADYLLLNRSLQRVYADSLTTAADAVPAGERIAGRRFVESRVADRHLADRHFATVRGTSQGRSGILTHPYLLSAFAYHDNSSPIHRGVFLTRNIIGRQLKPPPVAVTFENSDFAADLTMREKVTELTRDQACLACHEVINPLGFALENYDAVGRWRTLDNNKPIDTQSNYLSTAGTTVRFGSARDIANFAVNSPLAQRGFVTQVFQHLVQQSPQAYGPQTVNELQQAFMTDHFHIRKLLVHIATRTASHALVTSFENEAVP